MADDDLAEILNARTAPGCKLSDEIEGQKGTAREAIIKAVTNYDDDRDVYVWSASELASILKKKAGINVSERTIQRHRNGTCRCRSLAKGTDD